MNSLFERSSSCWVKYSQYELRAAADGTRYITPVRRAKPVIYDILKDAEAETLVVDALNVGLAQMGKANEKVVNAALMNFVHKYGLLGFMTALPTTSHFMKYDSVYLPKNLFIKDEVMKTEDYVAQFFPFERHTFRAGFGIELDPAMMALAAAFGDVPTAMNMSLQWEYAERYDWLLTQFKDWAFTFANSMIYYADYDGLNEITRSLLRKSMEAFGGIAPTYRIALLDKPTIVWDFHSLLRGVQMMFSFMLTDETNPLRTCRHCTKAFNATHPKVAFCSPRCKNQYNVYKSRAKKE